ncbi:hypothetical protein GCM10027051_33880 [Niabella terrae]
MPIQDYQTIMLPLLQFVADRKEYVFKDVVAALGQQFKLTEEELSEILPSGGSLLFPNRAGWARTYLKKARLLDSPKRGVVIITHRVYIPLMLVLSQIWC